MLKQTSFYDFINPVTDPVFNQINNLQVGDEIQVYSFKVRRTDIFYEVENDDFHEGFKTVDKCYSFICSCL